MFLRRVEAQWIGREAAGCGCLGCSGSVQVKGSGSLEKKP